MSTAAGGLPTYDSQVWLEYKIQAVIQGKRVKYTTGSYLNLNTGCWLKPHPHARLPCASASARRVDTQAHAPTLAGQLRVAFGGKQGACKCKPVTFAGAARSIHSIFTIFELF